jgi:hypothetical protein
VDEKKITVHVYTTSGNEINVFEFSH